MKTRVVIVWAACAMLASCTYSDDPRTGGLFGYWSAGDAGYQSRVDRLQNRLSDVESENAALARRSQELQGRRSSLSAQKARLSALRSEVRGLPSSVSLMGRINQAEAMDDNDPGLDARVRQLEKDVQTLKARQ